MQPDLIWALAQENLSPGLRTTKAQTRPIPWLPKLELVRDFMANIIICIFLSYGKRLTGYAWDKAFVIFSIHGKAFKLSDELLN